MGRREQQKGKYGERIVKRKFRDFFGGHWERRPLGIPGPDIFAPEWFPYAIEVKNDARVISRWILIRKRPTAVLRDFWMQASESAQMLNRKPLLVCNVEGTWFVSDDVPGHQWMKLDDWFRVQPAYNPERIDNEYAAITK